jgi:hypothetical protein
MYQQQMSAMTTHLVMLTAAVFFMAGQAGSQRHAADMPFTGLSLAIADSAPPCRTGVATGDGYWDSVTRYLAETETAPVTPYDAPECDG